LCRLLLSALLLLALLVGASSVVIPDYSRTTFLAAESETLKNELSRKTQNLQTLQEEKHALQVQLDLKGTGYNSEIVKLDLMIVGLQSEIEKLQYQQVPRVHYCRPDILLEKRTQHWPKPAGERCGADE
jgi:TolA-binding protein